MTTTPHSDPTTARPQDSSAPADPTEVDPVDSRTVATSVDPVRGSEPVLAHSDASTAPLEPVGQQTIGDDHAVHVTPIASAPRAPKPLTERFEPASSRVPEGEPVQAFSDLVVPVGAAESGRRPLPGMLRPKSFGGVRPPKAPRVSRGTSALFETHVAGPSARVVPEPPRAALASLEADNISAWFGSHQVLDRVSLTMPAGQVTALIGPSGCGKSTFLRILNRMHELVPSAGLAGEVRLDGEDIYDTSRKLIDARKSIGMVFQKPNPFPAMSIYDNVVAGLKLTGQRVSRDVKDELVESSLTKAGLWKEVKDRLRQPGGGLSGGQQQRLCIARSLAVTPRVLLMDEPCSALDPTSTRVIEDTMLELVKDVTIVIVTHNMQQAQRVSQQCAFFLASQGTPGMIVEHGDTEAMFADPIDPRTHDYVNGRFG